YIDYGSVQPIASSLFGRLTTIQGVVATIEKRRTATGKELVDAVIDDGTGRIHAFWFNPWVTRQLFPGTPVSLSGRVEQMRGNLCLQNPEWEVLGQETLSTGRITPVYPLVKNLSQKMLRPLVRLALDATRDLILDPLPDELRVAEELIGLRQALVWVHFPEGASGDEATRNLQAAQHRLAFDQFLALQLGLLSRKREWQSQPGTAFAIDREALAELNDLLPFDLTGAQRRAIGEILRDMAQPRPMTRLLQGDVGSGKTIVAALAAYAAIRDGYQVALMAPTEILAEQHARGLRQVFDVLPEARRPRIGYLTGSVGGAQRAAVYAEAAAGEVDLLIGTHTLMQEDVVLARLGLAIIDEQHRFGVEQRALLRGKGAAADVLVMTATPIPRTLALTLHGDLDVSTLDELPPGRQPFETYQVDERRRGDAYRFVRTQVERGRQAFIVFPLVEESETVDARAAVAEHERLSREVFPDLRVGLLHGRMRPAEKDEVMAAFRDRELDVLVSTSVIEVGIDIPNATVMLIDGADRFGLSQLHQFRGRVGRGAEKSYCLLVAGDTSSDGRTRLQAMVDTQDGFKLAQIDLELRGPGDFLGTRQSGLPELDLAAFADVRDLERARAAAERILAEDPELASAKHALLRARVDAFWARAVMDAG
ncbi:MAG TPA: ATP-dependent DNA helicase RecG, partial [Thermomicrobiales bacterium]|nr:ATP-dependent DNA helicase RecG [Thermomicrobiales bacterium]